MEILDLRGFITPFTLLKVSNTFKGLTPGHVLEVLWSNPETSSDLFKILPAASVEVMAMEELEEAQPPYFRARLKKRRS